MHRLLLLSILSSAAAVQAQALPPNTVDPHSPVDVITQVNALARACNFACTVHIPAGEYTVATGTIGIHDARLSLAGEGRNNTVIRYAGLNFLDAHLDAAHYDRSYAGAGTISGFTIVCTNPDARCIKAGSILNSRWQDLTIIGPGGITGSPPPPHIAEGFQLENTYNWMERTVFRDIEMGGFTSNFHFLAPRGGTDSFGYTLFDGIFTNQNVHTRNFVVDPGAAVYNVLGFTMQFNSGGTTDADEVFAIGGGFGGVGFHVTGENAGAKVTLAHIGCGGHMIFEGDYNVFWGPVVADCVQSKSNQGQPFRVAPTSGLFGVQGAIGGNGAMPGQTALGLMPAQTLRVWPYEPFSLENPYVNAYTGFVMNPGGNAAPISVFDPAVPWCVATRAIYAQPGEVAPQMCVSGAGDLAAAGSLRGTTIRTTRGTPASSHDRCTPGESWDDDDFHYHCTNRGEIRRSGLETF